MIEKKDLNLPIIDEAAFTESHRKGIKRGPRKIRESVREICEELGGNPVELCVNLVNGDYEALGFKNEYSARYDKDGNIVGETPVLTPELRFQAAKTLMEYIFSKKFVVGGDKNAPPIKFEGKAEVDYKKLAQMIKDAKGEG